MKVLWSAVNYKDSKDRRHEIASRALSNWNLFDELKQMDKGYTVFSKVCENGHIDILKKLIKLPVGAELINIGSPTPVWLAANSNQPQVLSLLLKNSSDPAQQASNMNPDGTSPLTIAIIRGNESAIQVFSQTNSVSTNEVARARIEFGDAETDMDYLESFPADEAALTSAVKSGQPELVARVAKMLGGSHPELSNQTTCVEVLKLVSRDRSLIEFQESNLTRLSRRFPTFKEEVEAKFERPITDEGRYEQLKRFHLKHDGFLLAKFSLKRSSNSRYMSDERKSAHSARYVSINCPLLTVFNI